MKSYLLNALPGALVPAQGALLSITPLSGRERDDLARALRSGEVSSSIGHADTAALISALLGGAPVPMARVSVPPVVAGTTHYLALYQGPRLPEGSTTLPEGASLAFYRFAALCPACDQSDPENRSEVYEVACPSCRAQCEAEGQEGALCAARNL